MIVNAKIKHTPKNPGKEDRCNQLLNTTEKSLVEFDSLCHIENRFFHIDRIVDQIRSLKSHIAAVNYNLEYLKQYTEESITNKPCHRYITEKNCFGHITFEINDAIIESENTLIHILNKIYNIENFYKNNDFIKSKFYIKESLDTVVNYVKLIYENITIKFEKYLDYSMFGNKSLFRDALFDIFQNFIPANYMHNNKDKIIINVKENNNHILITIDFIIDYKKYIILNNEFFEFKNNIAKDIITAIHKGFIYTTYKNNKPHVTINMPLSLNDNEN